MYKQSDINMKFWGKHWDGHAPARRCIIQFPTESRFTEHLLLPGIMQVTVRAPISPYRGLWEWIPSSEGRYWDKNINLQKACQAVLVWAHRATCTKQRWLPTPSTCLCVVKTETWQLPGCQHQGMRPTSQLTTQASFLRQGFPSEQKGYNNAW